MRNFFASVLKLILGDFLLWSPLILLITLGLMIFYRPKLNTWLRNIIGLILVLVLLLTIWGVHIERNYIKITNQTIQLGFKSRIVVISDTHLGLWKNQNYLNQVVDKINQESNIDAVLIPGDWTYEPEISKLDEIFEPFVKLKYPVYGVLGNHDVEQPGPNLRKELKTALEKYKVKLLNNDIVDGSTTGLKFDIVGLGDRWNVEDDVRILARQSSKPSIVITHNPETILKYADNLTPEQMPALTVTGHTHCGQVRIPWLYKLALPVQDKNMDKGLYNNSFFNPKLSGQLWISCGVGEVGLPIRLFNPPSIDVIDIQ